MKRFIKVAAPLTAVGLIVTLAATGAIHPAIAATPDSPATDTDITRLTTGLLEHSQFGHHPFDSDLAGALLQRYTDALDPDRSLFLQSDVDEFAAHRTNLAQATEAGDTTAAHAIFTRYLQRLEQNADYVATTLRTAKFDFTGHDAYSYDRQKVARPRDLAEARGLWWQQLRAEYLQEKLQDKQPDAIVSSLTRRHAQHLRTMKGLRSDEVLEVYLDALTHVYDPHSDYLGREQMESFSIAMKLSLVGIGATLESTDGYCTIRDLISSGPAARTGALKPGDRIVAVGQAGKELVDIVNMPLSRAVELIRGPKGSAVTLSVIPAGATSGSPPKNHILVREEVKLEDQAAKARVVDLPTGKGTAVRLGVLDLPAFYADLGGPGGEAGRSATADVARLLTKLKAEKVQGVVLDLRRNGGGSLDEAIRLTGLFIKRGPVVQTRDQDGAIDVGSDDDASVAYDGPLVVLTSRFSASASEILAGALQDYGRALIVGDTTTFGKGTVQNVLPLARVMDRAHLDHAYDPGALKITIEKFYRPSGASTQLRGVASDVVIPSPTDASGVSESTLQDPLPWDVIPAAPYEPMNRVAPYVTALRASSARRVAGEKDFADLAADIAQIKASTAAKSVSLNEAERRDELAQAKVRHDELERDDRALRSDKPTTSEKEDGDDMAGQGPADPVILNEGLLILADYVELTSRPIAAGGLATN